MSAPTTTDAPSSTTTETERRHPAPSPMARPAKDGEDWPPPNDYYVRNDDETTVLGPAPLTATAKWLPDIGVWLKLSDGEVVEITEQYVP